MTIAQLNSASKTALIEHISQLETNLEASKKETQNAVNIANYFGSVITEIEKLLLNSPFINNEGKFFKTLFWVMSNIKTVKAIVENIIAHIKEWRKQVNNLTAAQPAPEPQTQVA